MSTDTECSLPGTLLGTPNVIGGCAGGTTAACTTPLVTIYTMVTTTTRRLCAISSGLTTRSGDVVIPSVDFSFRPTTDGYYSLYYKTERVVLDLASGSLILPTTTPNTTANIEMKYDSIGAGGAQAMIVRVTGAYSYSVAGGVGGVVPIFQSANQPATNVFILASILSKINGEDCLVPALLTRDAYTVTTSLPESFALTQWSATGVTPGGAIISYPLSSVCSDNTAGANGPIAVSLGWTPWIYAILIIILLVLLFVIANALRRTEYVQDPRLPQAVALVKSMGR